jgi:hypothetical protein
MRAAIYNGQKQIDLTELPTPHAGDNDIVVRNLYASICGTDVAVYLHGPNTGHKLFSMLPFASLTFSGMKDRKGLFATISKEENRSQPLRKPSVRKKLEQTSEGQPKTPIPKKRGVER